ncbi:dihydrolipoamide branched chain transacylase E2 [Temnothorax americanus]|uniref:dihydrolipoamide branched chain transacylase E2 n=1 Tax=Temnothorax americanus TaxID=1964332 RepID=UPI004067F42B
MALSWRMLTAVRLAERSRHSILRRLLSASSLRSGRVIPFNLADIGEGIRDVTVKEWYVKPGDRVNQFDKICDVESDKAAVTITSRYDGFVKTLHYKVDDVAMVGSALCDIEIEDDSKDESTSERDDVEESVRSAENQETGKAKEREIDEETDNSKNRETEINEKIYIWENKKREMNEVSQMGQSEDIILGKVLATPAVRKIAKENNIKLKDVTATGKEGRVLKEDILAHLQKISADSKVRTEVKTEALSFTNVTGKTVGLKGYSKHMWKTMTKSLSIPHFVYSDECNVNQVMRYRNEVKDSLRERGVFLTLLPFFVKAASLALEQCPKLNAWLDEESQTLMVLDNHNIGIAMDTPEGLVVPNIKNVQNLSVHAIARELNRLQECGSKSSIPLADLTGTTFTLSNIGVVGGTYTKPVILPPQVIIGAFGKAQKLPRFDDKGNVVPASIMSVSWSADHRVVDGVTVAKFSNLWKQYVENPAYLLIDA